MSGRDSQPTGLASNQRSLLQRSLELLRAFRHAYEPGTQFPLIGELEEFLARPADETKAPQRSGPDTPDNSMVICPNCTSQFVAISVNDQTERRRLVSALAMMYDKYEDGTACYEDPEDFTGYLGNAIKLTDAEDIEVLSLIPQQRSPEKTAPPPTCMCGHAQGNHKNLEGQCSICGGGCTRYRNADTRTSPP